MLVMEEGIVMDVRPVPPLSAQKASVAMLVTPEWRTRPKPAPPVPAPAKALLMVVIPAGMVMVPSRLAQSVNALSAISVRPEPRTMPVMGACLKAFAAMAVMSLGTVATPEAEG